jgi:iron(III) transport system substrate-binding protein
MRRYLPVILFFVVLIAPFVVQRAVKRTDEADASLPVGDGVVRELVIVTPHNQDIRWTFSHAFSDWHRTKYGQSVHITFLTPGGTNDIVRLLSDTYGAYRFPDGKLKPEDQVPADIDMMWGGGDFPFDVELKPRGLLKPASIDPQLFKAAFPTPDIAGVPLYEPVKDGQSPRWIGVALSGFGIVYSPELYQTLGLEPPKTWSDLTDPKLAGFVALADPTRSGSAAQTYMTMLQRAMVDEEDRFFANHPDLKSADRAGLIKQPAYFAAISKGWKRGMSDMLLMAANARYFTDSAPQVPGDVANGDSAVGIAIDFYGRSFEEQVGSDRIRYVSPRSATSINSDPIAILYGVKGQRLETANRLIEFLLTPDAQRLWNLKPQASKYVRQSLRRVPIRRDVYADRTDWTDDMNPFEESGGFNLRSDWQGLMFTDIRPIWAAAWIDARTALKESYAEILAVKDESKRAELIQEFGDLPIELTDILNQRTTRREMDAKGADSRQWMTKQRVEWAQKFRDHYAQVASRAK